MHTNTSSSVLHGVIHLIVCVASTHWLGLLFSIPYIVYSRALLNTLHIDYLNSYLTRVRDLNSCFTHVTHRWYRHLLYPHRCSQPLPSKRYTQVISTLSLVAYGLIDLGPWPATLTVHVILCLFFIGMQVTIRDTVSILHWHAGHYIWYCVYSVLACRPLAIQYTC